MTTAILDTPKWLLIVRAFQIVISIIVLGISSYGVYWVVFNVCSRFWKCETYSDKCVVIRVHHLPQCCHHHHRSIWRPHLQNPQVVRCI